MKIKMIKSKISGATITELNKSKENYIIIDKNLLIQSGIQEFEFVNIFNIKNGISIEAYVISGEINSGLICLSDSNNFCLGDLVNIYSQCFVSEIENFDKEHKPIFITVDKNNNIKNKQVKFN